MKEQIMTTYTFYRCDRCTPNSGMLQGFTTTKKDAESLLNIGFDFQTKHTTFDPGTDCARITKFTYISDQPLYVEDFDEDQWLQLWEVGTIVYDHYYKSK